MNAGCPYGVGSPTVMSVPSTAAATATSTSVAGRPAGEGEARLVVARPLAWVLLGVTAVLLTLNVVVKMLADPGRDMTVWLDVFDVNREMNVPTVWNAVLMVGVSTAALLVLGLLRRRRLGWALVALVTLVMAFDEMLRWHEQLRGLGARLDAITPFSLPTYAWVLPGLAVALGLVLVALPWARRLPRDVRLLALTGTGMFFAGAVGAEAVSGWVDLRYGTGSLYTVVTVVEEALEMTGCIVVLLAVLRMVHVVDGPQTRTLTVRPDVVAQRPSSRSPSR